MSDHTKEPWAVAPSHDGGQHIANVDGIVVIYQNQKNMDRIVACVNACAGINPEAVPEVIEALRALIEFEQETYSGISEWGNAMVNGKMVSVGVLLAEAKSSYNKARNLLAKAVVAQ